jgi:hypothetical protein
MDKSFRTEGEASLFYFGGDGIDFSRACGGGERVRRGEPPRGAPPPHLSGIPPFLVHGAADGSDPALEYSDGAPPLLVSRPYRREPAFERRLP